jgi:murein DD-endopeptidase MepM/ murein hydrolase activator NlpD
VVDVGEVVSLNRLVDPNCIVPGQKLFIPGVAAVKSIPLPRKEEPESASIEPVPEVSELSPSFKDSTTECTQGFVLWPIREFTAYRESGFGIDIAVSGDVEVRTVAAGEVVGEGDLKQFGTKKLSVIAVEHENLGLYTVYMYKGHSLVSTGDLVDESQPIAMLEEDGVGEEAVVHFEVRQLLDAEPLNPLDYLP